MASEHTFSEQSASAPATVEASSDLTEDLRELRNLIGQAHATLALMYGTTDTRRAMGSLQRAQALITARLEGCSS